MGTKLKTIPYWFPILTSANDNSETSFTQITVELPESSKVFKSVIFEVWAHCYDATPGNIIRRQLSISVNGASYTNNNNTESITQTGENICFSVSSDFTSHFSTNFSGTSHTVDAKCIFDSDAGTPGNFKNISGKLLITYEYDDTSSTQIKVARFPLDAPVGAMATSKPGTANATIIDLSTGCKEASKTFKQTVIVCQGNMAMANPGEDLTLSMEIDTNGAYTSEGFQYANNSDMFYRVHSIQSFTTNASHSFYVWANVAKFNHQQIWLEVTYTFNVSTTTSAINSIMLPVDPESTMGGTTSSDYQRIKSEFYIEEPATISVVSCALFLFFSNPAAISGINARIGTGSFIAYTDGAAAYCGGNALMIRNDSISLARGKNTLTADIYRTDATDMGEGLSGFWMINYTSGLASTGIGSHNQTIIYPFYLNNGADINEALITAWSLNLPESNYYFNNIGNYIQSLLDSTTVIGGISLFAERLSGEGGILWEKSYLNYIVTDTETGIHNFYASNLLRFFKRWIGDPDSNRIDIETARRWWIVCHTASGLSYFHIELLLNYHSITKTVSGTISGSAGGSITIELFKSSTGEKVMATSRTGNGAYSFTWFDDVDDVFVVAYESSSLKGMSKKGTANTDFDISLSSGGGTYSFIY